MKQLTFEEEQNHIFNKKKVQKLISELNSFLIVLLYFCEGKIAYAEDGEEILYILRYITKISARLFLEFEASESSDD